MRRPTYSKWIQLMFDCEYSQIPETGQFKRFLVYCLNHHPDPRMRYICAHHAGTNSNPSVKSALVRRIADSHEHPVVRAEALEALRINWSPPYSRLDRRVHRLVADCLRDPDPLIRFWACYTACKNRMHWLIPVLRTMVDDQERGAMGETVGFEAREAIKQLQFGNGWEDGFPSRLPPAASFENLHVNPYATEVTPS